MRGPQGGLRQWARCVAVCPGIWVQSRRVRSQRCRAHWTLGHVKPHANMIRISIGWLLARCMSLGPFRVGILHRRLFHLVSEDLEPEKLVHVLPLPVVP